MALSNRSVSRKNRWDEARRWTTTSWEVEITISHHYNFITLQMDECTIWTYVRYIDKEEFKKKLFCRLLETNTQHSWSYKKLSNYFDDHEIPKTNIVLCAADGTLAMIGKNPGCLKLMKDDKPNILVVHCVVRREISCKKCCPSTARNTTILLPNVSILSKHMFQKFCEANHADHVILLLHTEVRRLSAIKGKLPTKIYVTIRNTQWVFEG